MRLFSSPWLQTGLLALALSSAVLPPPALAQNITAAGDGTGTTVDYNAATQTYTINGGTQIDANLFHSFRQFGLSTVEIANFLANPDVANILARVTGGNASVIDGLLQVSGGSNANLFILNPAGVLLGRNANLNLAGSFSVTTASGLTFGDEVFNATGSNDYAALTGNPNGYVFLGNEGGLLNEADLAVNPGESLTLGGSTVINTGTLEAPEGNVSIVAVPEEGILRISQEGLVLSLAVSTDQLNGVIDSGITPLDLPALLAGDWGGDATTVSTLADGTVVLGASPLNTEAGAITSTGTIDVSGVNGGDVALIGNDIALPEGLIDISGTTAGGYLGVYARDDLSFGLTVDAAGGGYALFDPVTLNIGAVEAATIVGIVQGGGTSDQQASETININAPITVTSGTGGTLTFTDEDSNNDLTINLNALISLSAGHTLTGEGTTVNVTVTNPGIVQNALDVAAAGADVNLGAGTYQEGQQLNLTRDITLTGAGTSSTQIDGANSHRVLLVEEGVTATLNALAIINGSAPSNWSVISSATTVLELATGNGEGGGIANFGNLTINDSRISNNRADYGAGVTNGIFNYNSSLLTPPTATLTLNNTTVDGNRSNSEGGGILNGWGSVLAINNSTLSNNATADNYGGAIANLGNSVSISNSTIVGNRSREGGGLYSYGGSVSVGINNSTIVGNTAFETSVTIPDPSGGPDITWSNPGEGGGIYIGGEATLTLTNSIVSGNTAEQSGVGSDDIYIARVDAWGNPAGIYAPASGNNIIGSDSAAGFYGPTDNSLSTTDTVPDVALSAIVQVDNAGNPVLADNGGSTRTVALAANSPAINRSGAGATAADQRGTDADGTRDIGAFEFGTVLATPGGGGNNDAGTGNLDPNTLFNRPTTLNLGEGPGAPILVIDPELAEQLGLQDRLNEDGTLAPRGPQGVSDGEEAIAPPADGTETLPVCTAGGEVTAGCAVE